MWFLFLYLMYVTLYAKRSFYTFLTRTCVDIGVTYVKRQQRYSYGPLFCSNKPLSQAQAYYKKHIKREIYHCYITLYLCPPLLKESSQL